MNREALTEAHYAIAWAGEGARVGIVICPECGASLLIGSRDPLDPIALHLAWHERTGQ